MSNDTDLHETQAQQQALYAQVQASRRVIPLDPAEEARREASQAAEEAKYEAVRIQERDERLRTTALGYAAGVCSAHGDPNLVLSAATDFLAFLMGVEKRAH